MNQHPSDSDERNDRILVIDDNPAIHKDFRKILCPAEALLQKELDADEASLFGQEPAALQPWNFHIDSAFQGQEGLEKVRSAAAAGKPYAVAFVDARMPPGWDGIETITHIWREFPDLQIVICTAYSDYSWDDITKAIGKADHVLVLKKPFDNIEVMQMAHALAKKWQLAQAARRHLEDLDALVHRRTAELRDANARLIDEAAERTVAEERFSKAFHGSPMPMAIQRTDRAGFLDVNERFLELLEAPRDAVLSGEAKLWTEPASGRLLAAELATTRTVRNLAASIVTARGENRDVLVFAENLELGHAPYYLLILQDITDRVRLEAELRQAQKMEAVGRLAAGVAHDFNNILTVILGTTSLQLRHARLDEKLATSLQQVVRAAERATELTRQLLAYSRKQIIQRRPLAVNEGIEQTVAMLRRIIGEHFVFELQLPPGLPPIFADASNVDQVVMNLALNARDAMPDGGKITITTSLIEIDGTAAAYGLDAKAGRFVCLAVKDQGHGMSAATVAKVFEPFFTTKEPGKGTGMGLATVYGILRQHDGWIDVESEPGRGAVFRAFFPLSSSQSAELQTESRAALVRTHENREQITILVVEDEEMLREFVEEALGLLGYRVLSAANGYRALEMWSEHRDQIDLLLTDVVMPGSISGRQLAQQLLADRPKLKVIFTSGYSDELIGPEFEQDVEHSFLPKPYRADRLAQIIAAQFPSEKS